MDTKHNYRYERKFTTEQISEHQVELFIKSHKSFFREIYYQRRVNNLYFDTPQFQYYFDNKIGISERRKVRIRWYGDNLKSIENPVLEVKLKDGLVGDKWQYSLPQFAPDSNFMNFSFKDLFSKSDLPQPIFELIRDLRPSLSNSYLRKYFQTADEKFRMTIDHDMRYGDGLRASKWPINQRLGLEGRVVLELKYNIENDSAAQLISNQIPFRLDKSSKYVSGMDIFHPQND